MNHNICKKAFTVFIMGAFVNLCAQATPHVVWAQEAPEEEPQERIVTLREGDPAPFDGTLFSVAAAAALAARLEFTQEQCDIQIQERVARREAEMQLQIDLVQAQLDALRYRHENLLDLRDSQVEFLQDQLRPPQWYESGEFWFTMGVLGGVLVVLAAGLGLGLVDSP